MTLAAEGVPAKQRGSIQRMPGVVPMPGPATSLAAGEARGIAAALINQDMILVGTLPLEPSLRATKDARDMVSSEPLEVTVEVDLKNDESAVVLLEQDGLYAWHFDGTDTLVSAGALGNRQRGPKARARTVTFLLSLKRTPKGPAKTRGWLSDLVVGRAQAFVFKFAGRFLLNRGAAFLERKVQTGFVIMDRNDPDDWRNVVDLSALKLPEDRRARILLFIHGTFSSTRGGFAALAVTPWGRSFLEAARANYDAVIGFDHPTLSVDPLVNATAILRGLETRNWIQPAVIDAVSHSRGGITLRSLTEHLLPAASLPVRVERAVFVGAVNGGTELAEPKNWRSFINIYTNIAAGACRAIAMFPQTVLVAKLTEELFKSVGVLAKVLVEETVTGEMLPGLAAMQPTGPFITQLNQTQPGQPRATDIRYYAITSDFDAELAIDSLKDLPGQLLRVLANGALDQVMGKANDLVVNTDSMTHLDPGAGGLIQDTLAFGKNGVVYHTNYFLQPQATNALARWFELELPQVANPARQRGLVQPGAAAHASIPARVDTDVLVAMAEDIGRETLDRINRRTPSYVVVERIWQANRLFYAFRTEEVIAAISPNPDAMLLDALNLRETDASPHGEGQALPEPLTDTVRPSAGRVVALEDGKVVGVAEAAVVPAPIPDLVQQALQMAAPKNERTGILVRRMMPSFLTRGPQAAWDVGALPEFPLRPATQKTRGPSRVVNPAITISELRTNAPITKSTLAAKPSKVVCHFLAEMDDEVAVGETTEVDVTLSREVIMAVRAATASSEAEVQTDRKLTVEIIPKKNFLAAGDTRVEADLPKPGNPAVYIFDVKATDAGSGEVLVRIRQGMQLLSSFLLRCRIVKERVRPAVRRQQEALVMEAPPQPEPLHQLTIIEIERGGKQLYEFILDSPSLNLKDIYESKPLTGSREDFIKGIYEDIEGRYLSTTGDLKEFQKELREVGAELWDELFPEKLQSALWERRDKIASILVFSEEPFVPWELVHLKEPGKGLPVETRFFAQMGLVRWLHNVGWPTTELRAREGKCRYVIPHYPHPDYKLVAAEKEAKFLEDSFKATSVDPHAGPLRELLETTGSFDLLHFACHGVADSGDIARAELLLEGRVEGDHYVTEKFRASVIEQGPGLVGASGIHPIVTLNACQAGRAGYKMTSIGGFSRAFLKQGAGMFCAALWSVGDEPARKFTETLYERLKADDSLAEATIAARERAASVGEGTWLAYTVYGNPYAKLIS